MHFRKDLIHGKGCDGAQPQCKPCSKSRNPQKCTYKRLREETLQRKQSCWPCRYAQIRTGRLHDTSSRNSRRSKRVRNRFTIGIIDLSWQIQRCDAVRPCCCTCKKSGRDDCDYEADIADRRRWQRDNEGNLHEIEPALRHPSTRYQPKIALGKSENALVLPCPSSRNTTYTVMSSLHFPRTPSSPLRENFSKSARIALEDIENKYAFALSHVSLNDLNLKL